MTDREFNLLHEKWICVLTPQLERREVSMLELFEHAHEYLDLAGELPTQDVAVLRLLLAVMHTVFSRVDADGRASPIEDYDGALERWSELWERGSLPIKPIRDYLMKWEDRFWLFDPERPFYQIPKAKIGTEYTAAKLNGELSESSNKVRLFPAFSADAKRSMGYAEAARWLLYVNAYDDTSSKATVRGGTNKLPSPGAGWLGKLGLICNIGDNLFETLALNLVLLKDGAELWGENKPVWERAVPKEDERTEIVLPDNPAQLLTLQSRRLMLDRDETGVTGYYLLGGDFFAKEGAFSEQMTIWSVTKEKKSSPVIYLPKRHNPSKQMWREFQTMTAQGENLHRPGVVAWLALLRSCDLIEKSRKIRLKVAAVIYGDKDFFVVDIYSDALDFSLSLLDKLSALWIRMITEQIDYCDRLAKEMYIFARNLDIAGGGTGDTDCVRTPQDQLYYRFDSPFRAWLRSIDPMNDDMDEKIRLWRKTAWNVTLSLGREMVRTAGQNAFVGRSITQNEKTRHYSSSEAFNWFLGNISKIK